MKNSGKHKYEEMGKKEILEEIEKIEQIYQVMCEQLVKPLLKGAGLRNEVSNICTVDAAIITDIIRRVHRGVNRYSYFHDINGLLEHKEASLYCFWICKLKPISIKQEYIAKIAISDQENRVNLRRLQKMNEYLGVFIVIYCLNNQKAYEKTKYSNNGLAIDSKFLEHFMYNLTYRDLSEEALILITEQFYSHSISKKC